MLKNYILQYLRDEISYRTERCIKVLKSGTTGTVLVARGTMDNGVKKQLIMENG